MNDFEEGRTILVNKPIGMTPLQAIQKYKEKHQEDKDVKMGYAGRLDPMAHGLLLILSGNQVKSQKEHELMRKEYEFEVLFGAETDTFDILGISSTEKLPNIPIDLVERIQDLIPKYVGKHQQSYPPYSSARVNGKPLFQWAKDGKLSQIQIPNIEIEVYSLSFIKSYELSSTQILDIIMDRISKVTSGDFRQKDIIEKWKKIFNCEENKNKKLSVIRMVATVSPGTYIRTLAHKFGKDIGTNALAFEIYRTKAGNHKIEDAVEL